MVKTTDLFSLEHTLAKDYLKSFTYPWEALKGIKDLIINSGENLDKNQYTEITPQVWVHKEAVVAPTAFIGAPCIIGKGTEIRHCAFIRGSALIGEDCVIGNSVEIKNAIIFDGAQVPHFNYVGDSILGYKAHMGAGSVTSNIKSDKSPVFVKFDGESIETGLIKFGAMLGDCVEVGCNSVLNPGTVIGKNSNVYPTSCVRGVIKENHIYKDKNNIIEKR